MTVLADDALESATVAFPEAAWDEWFLTQLGGAIDAMMLRAMRLAIDSALMPSPAGFAAMKTWEPLATLADEPRRFFDFLDRPAFPMTVSGHFRRRLSDGAVFARELSTAYQPYDVGGAESTSAPRADDILLEHWIHENRRPRGTVIAIHGFSMGRPRIDAFTLFASEWFNRGLDVAVLVLPSHGARTPPGARFSGEAFATTDAQRMNEAARQAIFEMHAVTCWLRRETGAPVGLMGLSLGGYLSALMAGLSAEPDFVVPIVPPVCIGDLAWRFIKQSRHYRAGRSAGVSREELRTLYRVHSPLTYVPMVPKERLMIVAGRGDQIVPPEHPHALWRHWNEPEIHWFSGSHLAPFRRGRIAQAIAEHLERLDIL